MADLRPGLRLASAVCDAEVMVIKAPAGADLTCGGAPMVEAGGDRSGTANDEHMHGCVIGKRYVNADETLEVLCVKAGEGSVGSGGALLMTKDTKKLPSSD
jgi:hypothetical protein